MESIKLECSCGESATISSTSLRKYIKDDINLSVVMELAPRFRCGKCGRKADASIFDDKGRLLFDPERIRECSSCKTIIPFARTEALPHTNLCITCAVEGVQKKTPEPYPQPPADLKFCPKCGAHTAMYQNSKFKNWFVGCSTYPKCHWSKYR